MASAWRAATSMTRGPVAATSTGTFGACTRSSHSRRLAKPPRSTASPRRYPCKAARWRSKLATRSSRLPMRCTEESPRPIPRTARPPLSAWRASAAEAVTAGSRVTELVTPGPRWTRVVACAASMSWPQTSGARFWLSGKRTVSKPSSSRRRAVRADRRGSGTARTPNSILGGYRREVDPVELGDVLAEDRAPLLRGERAGVLGQQLLRPRPGRVAVREVVGPHEPPPVHHADAAEGDPVVLEGGVDALREVLRGQLRERLPRGQPVPVALVGVVHAVHVVRHPARVGLDAHHPELRVPLEDAAQDERPHDVLAAADDGEEGVHAGPARGRLARGEDVEGWRQAERHDRLPELVVRRRVVVLDAGNAGEHDAAEPDRLDGLEVPDALRRRAHRGLADAEQALGVVAAVLGHPAVERVAAGLLVVEVAVVADRHADRRVDDLGCDAVPLLIGEPRLGVPAAAVKLLEARPHEPDLLRRLPRRSDDAQRDRHLEALDDEHVARALDVLETRRAVAVRRVDVVDIGVRRLGHVRVGRDDRVAHDARPPRSTRPGSGPSGSTASRPSSRITTPFTTTARMPRASETSRSAPAGKSRTRRSGEQPTVAGSKTVTSAASPGARRPRSAMPKTSAGWLVSRRTASSSESTPRSRTQVPSNSVGAQASPRWLACAPASERPIMVAGCASSSATIAGSVLRIGMRKRVSRSAASERSSARSTGCTPRSAATSPRRRSATDGSGGCSVIVMSRKGAPIRPSSIRSRSARRNAGSA